MASKKLWLWIGLNVLCVGFWTVLFLNGKEIHLENGPMENSQLAGLAVAAVIFLVCVCQSSTRPRTLFCASLFWLMLNFTVRETRVRGADNPQFLVFILNDPARVIWLTAGWVVLFFIFTRDARRIWAEFLKWAQTPGCRLMVCAGIFFMLSYPFDSGWLPIEHRLNMFLDEAPESVAGLLIIFSAMETLSWVRKARIQAPHEFVKSE